MRATTASLPRWATELPYWVDADPGGGRAAWARWVASKVSGCRLRAGKSASTEPKPSQASWRGAVIRALRECGGLGEYSQLPLTLAKPSTHALYPSIEHRQGLRSLDLGVEVRLVNDMKSILSRQEFVDVIAHLTMTLKVQPCLLPSE